jgi:hypothetical protein
MMALQCVAQLILSCLVRDLLLLYHVQCFGVEGDYLAWHNDSSVNNVVPKSLVMDIAFKCWKLYKY